MFDTNEMDDSYSATVFFLDKTQCKRYSVPWPVSKKIIYFLWIYLYVLGCIYIYDINCIFIILNEIYFESLRP